MRVLLFIGAVLAFLAGLGIFIGAQSAIHEIEGFLLFLISAVLLVGAVIVDAIIYARKSIDWTLQELSGAKRSSPSAPVKPPIAPRSSEFTAKRVEIPAYFYSTDGTDCGPYSAEQMLQFRREGKINDQTLVCRRGDKEWLPAGMFIELTL